MKNLHDILRAKEAQLVQLQQEIAALRTTARILEDEDEAPAKKPVTKPRGANLAEAARPTQPIMIRTVLEQSGQPLHVDAIAEAIKKRFAVRLESQYLTSIIYRMVKKGRMFKKEAPNTFGLLEWPSPSQLKLEVGDNMRAVQ